MIRMESWTTMARFAWLMELTTKTTLTLIPRLGNHHFRTTQQAVMLRPADDLEGKRTSRKHLRRSHEHVTIWYDENPTVSLPPSSPMLQHGLSEMQNLRSLHFHPPRNPRATNTEQIVTQRDQPGPLRTPQPTFEISLTAVSSKDHHRPHHSRQAYSLRLLPVSCSASTPLYPALTTIPKAISRKMAMSRLRISIVCGRRGCCRRTTRLNRSSLKTGVRV